MSETKQAWAGSLLKRLGIKDSPGARKALVGWADAEGGHFHNRATFNVLNTTQEMPGAGNTGAQGNIKVYTSWGQGLDATVKTLENGKYGGILTALKKGDANGVANAIGASPWGTSADLIRRTIGSASAGSPTAGLTAPSGKSSKTTTVTTPGQPQQDVNGALTDILLKRAAHPGKHGSLLKSLNYQLSTGKYNSTSPATTSHVTVATQRAGGGSDTTPTGGATPAAKGTADFEGATVAAWIKPVLEYARKEGWKGSVKSGFRSLADQTRIYNSGVRPAAKPGTSNHEGADFPRGAVDVSDAPQLSAIISKSKYSKLLQWAGSKDPVHFSHPHGGSY